MSEIEYSINDDDYFGYLLASTHPKISSLRLGSLLDSTGIILMNCTSSSCSGKRTFCSVVSSDGPVNVYKSKKEILP
jgi:hypothetical protein